MQLQVIGLKVKNIFKNPLDEINGIGANEKNLFWKNLDLQKQLEQQVLMTC